MRRQKNNSNSFSSGSLCLPFDLLLISYTCHDVEVWGCRRQRKPTMTPSIGRSFHIRSFLPLTTHSLTLLPKALTHRASPSSTFTSKLRTQLCTQLRPHLPDHNGNSTTSKHGIRIQREAPRLHPTGASSCCPLCCSDQRHLRS